MRIKWVCWARALRFREIWSYLWNAVLFLSKRSHNFSLVCPFQLKKCSPFRSFPSKPPAAQLHSDGWYRFRGKAVCSGLLPCRCLRIRGRLLFFVIFIWVFRVFRCGWAVIGIFRCIFVVKVKRFRIIPSRASCFSRGKCFLTKIWPVGCD